MKATKVKGGWQCNVEFYEDHVIKKFKDKKEIEERIRSYLRGRGKTMDSLSDKVDSMIKDRARSLRLIKTNKVPRKLLAFPEFLDGEIIKQKRARELGDVFESCVSANDVRKWKLLVGKLVDFMVLLWSYGIDEKPFKITSNFGILDDKIVLIDFLELEGNKRKVEKRIRKKRWLHYNNEQKIWRKYPKEFVDYFVKRCDSVLTIENLNKNWKKKIK